MKKEMITTIICSTIAMFCCFLFFYLEVSYESNMYVDATSTNHTGAINIDYVDDGDTHIVASIDDDIQANTMRCGTFQLVWNDMVNEVVKKDVEFDPQLKIAENLNKQTFTTAQLSPNGYYKKFGLFTRDIKDEIENGIKQKFNETSDVLNSLDWSEAKQSDADWEGVDPQLYLFYVMLKKVFNFEYKFDVLAKGSFADEYNDVEYFGIKSNSSNDLRKQVSVLYYNSENDFAVLLKTKEGEDVILQRGTNGTTFYDTYLAVMKKAKKSKGGRYFGGDDYLRVPKLSIDVLKEYNEFYNKEFIAADGNTCKIKKALQTIQFDLDEKGGKIKSEAVIEMSKSNGISHEEHNYRYFYFDKPFMIFLKESDKELPYFAAQITNIKLFQK